MDEFIMNEATGTEVKYQKKYKCPYCDMRFTRPTLSTHIQKKHEDMIPEGFTALRVAFNTINNKTKGTCVVCKEESPWNEDKGRYERLCGKKSCKDKYVKTAHDRVKDVYGTESILKDPRYAEEMQKKMLANRKISGTYTFADGGKVGYTGTYEKKLLEFMDTVMNIISTDVISPGPVIYYKFGDKTLMYITDFLYEPYNLIIEVKDGGDNPNNRVMEEYRAKQIAKEKAVKDGKQYNYLRLTNNNFSQLMEIMAVLKYSLQENPDQLIVKIHESMSGVIGGALGPAKNSTKYFMTQYLKNNTFVESITRDPSQDEFISIDPEKKKVVKLSKKDMPGYITFKLKDEEAAEELYNEALEMLRDGATVDDTDYFYRKYTGRNLLVPDQMLYDESFEYTKSFDDEVKMMNESLYNEIMNPHIQMLDSIMKSLD